MEFELKFSEAFEAMKGLLEQCNRRTQSDDISGLLGDLSLLSDGMPADRATWQEWLESIKKIGISKKDTLSTHEAFEAMKDFLKEYADRIESKDVWQLLDEMRQIENGATVNPIYGIEWMEMVEKAKKGKKGMLASQK